MRKLVVSEFVTLDGVAETRRNKDVRLRGCSATISTQQKII